MVQIGTKDTQLVRRMILTVKNTSLLKEDFTNLLVEKLYKRRINEKGKIYYRLHKVLQLGKWQELITNKFWEAKHIKCGFQFKNHYISADAKTDVINGKIVMNGKIL